ncbi:MAG TPA: CBS domain-containing protein [Actinomycetota bacterium]|jgi:CBS domain-containing protein|nr:CBS domain-containing protein [Actinomycetota bacterium]
MDSDVFRREAEARFGSVGQAMTANVITLGPQTRASDAALRLSHAGVAGAPVVEGGMVVGVVTLRDLLEREGHVAPQTSGPFLRGERHLANLTVAEVMTRDVVTIYRDETLLHAIDLMDAVGVNRLPVVDEEARTVGILARDDVIHAIAQVIRALTPVGAGHHDAHGIGPHGIGPLLAPHAG